MSFGIFKSTFLQILKFGRYPYQIDQRRQHPWYRRKAAIPEWNGYEHTSIYMYFEVS